MAKNKGLLVFWLFLPGIQLLTSCQQTHAAKDLSRHDSEIRPGGMEDDKVPMDLWSPTRRKANASFYYLTGEYEALNRNMGKARKFLENAYNLDPNPFLASKLIEAKANEDVESGLHLARKMVLLYPSDGEIQLLYGRLLSAAGQFEKAEQHIRLATKYTPHQVEAYVVLLQLLQAQQKYKEAVPIAKEMLRNTPEFADGWMQLARIYLTLKQKKEALEPARRAYELDGNDPERVHLYAVVLDVNGDSKKAIGLYEAVLRLDPTNDDLIARMVGHYKLIGSLDDALKMLQKAEKEAKREVPGIRLQMAFIFWEMQRFKEASELLDELAQRNPQAERILYMSGLGQERTQQYERALKTYQGFDSSSEFYVHSRYRMIELHRRAGQTEEALAVVREVIDTQVDRSVDFYPLGANILGNRQRYAEAIKLLDEGFQKYPERVDLLFLKAVNLEKTEEFDDCVETLKQVISKEPDHAAAHNYLGYLYAEKGINLEEAEFHVKKALEIKPEDGYYLDSLGWIYFQQGHYKKALDVLLRANELVPDEAVVLEHLGDTYEVLGDMNKALEIYGKASKAKMEDKDRLRIQEKYERVKKKIS
ncbi:tetratricopeptide repeat protein [Oligoflexus tunisiensis]|uniref:tetratricopeptide repeat protein n=1 Tax=Oligoflexus tunisiensis TaxID=708132 RepID=UPI00114CACE8|nr:tetratricopeptide repeat protein [Oligoflexus tunisiensis]